MHFHENQSKKEMFAIEVCCVLTFCHAFELAFLKAASKATKKNQKQAWFKREQTKFFMIKEQTWNIDFRSNLTWKPLWHPFPLNFKFYDIFSIKRCRISFLKFLFKRRLLIRLKLFDRNYSNWSISNLM